jgi:hypothetical protein
MGMGFVSKKFGMRNPMVNLVREASDHPDEKYSLLSTFFISNTIYV